MDYNVRQIVANGKPEHSICPPGLSQQIEQYLQEKQNNNKLKRGKHPYDCRNPYLHRWCNDERTKHYAEYDALPWRPAMRIDPPILLGPFKTSVLCAKAERELLKALERIDLGEEIYGGGGILCYLIYYKENRYRVYTYEVGVGLGPMVGVFDSRKNARAFWPRHQDAILEGKKLVISPSPL